MPHLRDATPPVLRRARWGTRGYAVEAVDRWGSRAADALALPAGPEADAALDGLLRLRMDLPAALSGSGDRYRKADVDALVDWVIASAPEQATPASPSTAASASVDDAPTLRPQELIEHRFGAAPRFVEGYSADSVDDWLDQAAAALAALEDGTPAASALTAADAESVRFPMKRGASAYPIDEVDGLLDRVVAALRTHEARAAGRR